MSVITITGVQYAANPDYDFATAETEAMRVRTRELLMRLEAERPRVVLMREPGNCHDVNAVMARAWGRHIGYVSKDDQPQVYERLPESGMMMARIVGVSVHDHGVLQVEAMGEQPAEGPCGCSMQEVDWSCWACDVPLLARTEREAAAEEATFVLADLLATREAPDVEELRLYVKVWAESCRHDLSGEARDTCSRFISCMETSDDIRVREQAQVLVKYRASMCSRRVMVERVNAWWNDLLSAPDTQKLWMRWREQCGGELRDGLRLIDASLRLLPGELYRDVERLEMLFSRLYYMCVPRRSLQSILALLLLRGMTCAELDIGVDPLADNVLGAKDKADDPHFSLSQMTGYCKRQVAWEDARPIVAMLKELLSPECPEASRNMVAGVEQEFRDRQFGNHFHAPVGQVVEHVGNINNNNDYDRRKEE